MKREPSRKPAPKNGPVLPPADWPGGARVKSREDRKQDAARHRPAVLTGQQVWTLLMLLVVPAAALYRTAQSFSPWLLTAGAAAISLSAWTSIRRDKLCAIRGQWRIPEATLHFMELLGGWPASYAAQRRYRHKTAKTSYQSVFWAIVLLHETAAADFLTGWQGLHWLREIAAGS